MWAECPDTLFGRYGSGNVSFSSELARSEGCMGRG
jgi:hypothetical protein